MKVNTKATAQRRIVAGLGILLMMSFLLSSVGLQNVFASGLGDVIVSDNLIMQHAMRKTVDLTNSGVDVTITQAERDSILAQSRKEAEKFINSELQNGGIKDQTQSFENLIINIAKTYDDVINKGYSLGGFVRDKNGQWEYDYSGVTSALPFLVGVEEIYALYNGIKNVTVGFPDKFVEEIYDQVKKDGGVYDETNTFYSDKAKELNDAYIDKLIEFKAQELYNNEINDLFVERLGMQLNVKFEFVIEPLAEDGSEDKAFGVDNTTIQRGTFKVGKKEMPFSTIDFGASNQVYDEILNEDMDAAVSDGANTLEGYIREYVPRDGRDVLTHALVFDLGQVKSSDDSQFSYGKNMLRSRAAGWEGMHTLLKGGDSLAAYEVFSPTWSYIKTFGLHVNPAVTYYADYVKADIINGAEFDGNGKLVSISKPIIPSDGYVGLNSDYLREVMANVRKYVDTSEPGTYRFKLVEKTISLKEMPNDATFNDNKEEKSLRS